MSFYKTAKSLSFFHIKLVPLPKIIDLKEAVFITANSV